MLPGYGMDAVDLWRHSMGVAFGARIIANKKKPTLSNDAFSAGLIHDAGKLILDPYLLERKEMFENYMSKEGKSFLDAEKKLLGFDHGEIASEVCNRWQTPQTLATAIKYHHNPSLANNDELTDIIHTADIIALMTGLGTGIDGIAYEADGGAIDHLGLTDGDINDIMVEVAESVDAISSQMH
jgi:HD-like signal output (HDOD) protein